MSKICILGRLSGTSKIKVTKNCKKKQMKDSDDSGHRKLTLNEVVIFQVDKNVNNKTSFNVIFCDHFALL